MHYSIPFGGVQPLDNLLSDNDSESSHTIIIIIADTQSNTNRKTTHSNRFENECFCCVNIHV